MRRLTKMVTMATLAGLLPRAVTAVTHHPNCNPRALEAGFPATLLDLQTGSTIAVEPGGSYMFTMDSGQNRFRPSLR